MNARFIALTVGIAAAVVSQLYLKHQRETSNANGSAWRHSRG